MKTSKMTKFASITATALLGLAALACTPTDAQATNFYTAPTAYAVPINVTLGYVDNKVVSQDGVRAELGTELKGVRLGVTTFATEDRFESYGAYAALPYQLGESRVSIVPRVDVEHYRKIDETIGYLGLGAEYQLTSTVRADAIYRYGQSFDRDADLDGGSYLVGLTKTF